MPQLRIKAGQPLSFRVYVYDWKLRKTKDYYRVLIFANHDDLREFNYAQSKLCGERRSRKYFARTAGACRHFGASRIPRKPNQIGVISYAKGSLSHEVISHEMTHAAVYALPRGPWPFRFTKFQDEHLARMQGKFIMQFYRWFYRQGKRQCRS